MAITGSQPSYMYALGGYARGGATRGGDTDPQTYITIGGVQVGAARAVDAQKVLDGTLSIVEMEGATPNTASFQVQGFQPTDGQDVVMTQGSKNNLDRLFAGTILTDVHGYLGTPANYNEGIHVIDYTWQLTRDTFSQRWLSTSATDIAKAIVTIVAGRGITSTYVASGLPVLDDFTVTNQTPAAALSALCARIGATWKVTYRSPVAGMRADVRLGITTDTTLTDPTTLTAASAALTGMTNFAVTRDLSPVITRQAVEGGGGNAAASVAVGDTILPVDVASWYLSSGGLVVTGAQRLSYTGVQAGGGGTLVGPGASPSAAPALARTTGTGLGAGTYQYAYTDVTASGETLPSPLGVVTTDPTALAAPVIAPVVSHSTFGSGGLTVGQVYHWLVTYQRDAGTGETTAGTASLALTADTQLVGFQLAAPPSGVNYINIYRTLGNGSTYYLEFALENINNVPAPGSLSYLAVGVLSDATLSSRANPPGVNTATAGGVNVSGIGIGATGTTSRKVYRTAVGATQLKLLTTIANNTATTIPTDTTADGSLGANAPTSDTSALAQPTGQILAGAATLLVAGAGAFDSGGGWAIIGNGQEVIRYTGLTGNTLTGIPASGTGAITATVAYNSTITAAPALTGIPASGVGSILYPITAGDPVNLRVVVDDLTAQGVIATYMLPTVDDGVIEGAVIQDGRISATEARARGTAQLAQRSAIDVGITYDTRDKNTHASRTIGSNLPAPTSVVGNFKLQSVTIDTFAPALWPTYHAHGANKRFTLEDLLRIARGATS